MFLATYAGMSNKKTFLTRFVVNHQAVSPEKRDFTHIPLPSHQVEARFPAPHSATVFSSSLLPCPSMSLLIRIHTDVLLCAKPHRGGVGSGGRGRGGAAATQQPTIDGGLQRQRWRPQQRLLHTIVFFVVVVVDNIDDGGRHQERGGECGGKENSSGQKAREDERWRYQRNNQPANKKEDEEAVARRTTAD